MPTEVLNTAPPPQKHHRGIFVWLLVLLIGGAGYYYYIHTQNHPNGTSSKPDGPAMGGERSRPPAVAVAMAKKQDVPIYLAGLGTVTAVNTVVLHARVDGQITKILFQEGQMVKAGDVLAELDPRPFQVQVDQTEAQLARDAALLENARVDLARYTGLYKEDSVAKQQLDTQAALVRQYQASVKLDQAQIENARLQLSFCHITAPTSGRIGLRQVDVGNLIHSSDPTGLIVITQLQPIGVVFPIPEDQLPTLMKHMNAPTPLPVEAWGRDGSTHLADGTLLTVDNQIDATTGTIKLKAQFPNREAMMFPNQFVNVRLLLETVQGATTLPTAAIQRGSRGTFVYLLRDDQTVTLRPVRLGPTAGTDTTLEDGILPGDRAIVDGSDKLREGMRVTLAGQEAQHPRTPHPTDTQQTPPGTEGQPHTPTDPQGHAHRHHHEPPN